MLPGGGVGEGGGGRGEGEGGREGGEEEGGREEGRREKEGGGGLINDVESPDTFCGTCRTISVCHSNNLQLHSRPGQGEYHPQLVKERGRRERESIHYTSSWRPHPPSPPPLLRSWTTLNQSPSLTLRSTARFRQSRSRYNLSASSKYFK